MSTKNAQFVVHVTDKRDFLFSANTVDERFKLLFKRMLILLEFKYQRF